MLNYSTDNVYTNVGLIYDQINGLDWIMWEVVLKTESKNVI